MTVMIFKPFSAIRWRRLSVQYPFIRFKVRLLLWWGLAILITVGPPVRAAEPFTMAFAIDPSEEPQYLFYLQIYTEAFKELGYEFRYELYPSKRCSLMANAGEVDGEPQRIFGYGDVYPNMVRVEEAIFINRTIAFATKPSIQLEGLESLKGTNYRVDYLRGSVWSRQQLQPLVKPDLLSVVSYSEQALRKLLLNRTDLFIVLEARVMVLLQNEEFKDTGIIPVTVVGTNLSYPFLHKSHAKLAPKLAEVLRQMKEDGRYELILHRTMPFLAPHKKP